MWDKLISIFKPPIFPGDDEKNRKAAALTSLIWGVMVAMAIHFSVSIVLSGGDLDSFLIPILVFPLLLFLRLLLNTGQLGVTSVIMIGGFFLLAASQTFDYGGIRSPAFAALTVVTLLGGLLLGFRGGIIVGAFSIIFGLVLGFAEMEGLIDPSLSTVNPWPYFLAHVAFIVIALSVLFLAIRNIKLGFEQADLARSERELALNELSRSEARYRAIVEDQTELINRVDLEGILVFANEAYANLFRRSAEDIIGLPLDEFLSDRGLENIRRVHGHLTPENPIATNEHLMVMPDGSERWLQWKDQLICDEDGNPLEYQGVGRDITEHRLIEQELRTSEERYRAVAESALVGIAITTEADNFSYVNPAFAEMLGYSQIELLSLSSQDLTTDESFAVLQAMNRRRKLGIRETYEIEMIRKDGVPRTFQVSASPLTDDEQSFQGTMAVVRDITDRIRAQQELTRQLEELQVLQSVAVESLGQINEDLLIQLTTKAISESGYYDHFGVLLLDETKEHLNMHASYHGLSSEELSTKVPIGDSISGRVVQTGKAIRTDDVRKADTYFPTTPDIRSELTLPLTVGDQIVGVIIAESTELQGFSNNDERLLTTIAGLLGTALERARLFKSAQALTHEMESLYKTALATSELHDLTSLFESIFQEVSNQLPVQSLHLLQDSEIEDYLVVSFAVDSSQGYLDQTVGKEWKLASNGSIQEVLDVQGSILVGDAHDTEFDLLLLQQDDFTSKSVIITPLQRGNLELGIVILQSKQDEHFTSEHLRFVEALTPHLSIAVENTLLFQQESDQRVLSEALRDTAMVITGTLEFDSVMDQILSNVGRVVAHDAANIMVVEEGTSYAKIVAHSGYEKQGIEAALVEQIQIPLLESESFKTGLQTGETLIIKDTRLQDGWFHVEGMEWIRSYVCAPIKVEDTVVGFINLDSASPNSFLPHHASRLKSFANQAAIAIENATLYRELERHAEFLEVAVDDATSELRQEKDRVDVILNNSPDPVLLLTTAGTIEMVNQSFTDLFLFGVDEIIGQNFCILVDPEEKSICNESFTKVVEEGMTSRTQSIGLRADDSPVDIEIALAPIKQANTIYGVVCTIRDISVVKEVERMKDAFVSNVSHELRTPITSLKLNHSLLKMNPENGDVYLTRLGREVDRLNILIEDLLRLSRLDQGSTKLNLIETDLNELLEQIVNDRTPLALENNQEISLLADTRCPVILADRGLIGQVASVFLTNALSYTPEGGKIEVRCIVRERDAVKRVGFEVRDDGPGIAPDELPKIFTRFYRGESAQSLGVPGTGLGLSIAQEIVTKHEGEIEVESSGLDGEGALFRVLLPVDRKPLPEEPIMRRTRKA